MGVGQSAVEQLAVFCVSSRSGYSGPGIQAESWPPSYAPACCPSLMKQSRRRRSRPLEPCCSRLNHIPPLLLCGQEPVS